VDTLKSPRVRFNWGYHDGASDYARKRPRKWLHGHPHDKVYGQGYDYGYEDAMEGTYSESSDAAWASRASLRRAPWMPHRHTTRARRHR
jgi:hypothetical protein